MNFEEIVDALMTSIGKLDSEKKIKCINHIKSKLNDISDFQQQPVDNVLWIPSDQVVANDYNPNKVAPPEMKLLELSILEDGYTQPIVAYYDEKLEQYTVVDGYHRNRVGKECKEVNERTKNHLPVVVINKPIQERIASTIRHNRARGVHGIKPMSEIVAQLYMNGWSNKKISNELGMDVDEVLRLKQFTGLGSLFKNREFSKAWDL